MPTTQTSRAASHRFERHLVRGALAVLLPLREKRCIIFRDVIRGTHAQLLGGFVYPARRAFDLGEISDGSLVHDHLALAIVPLRTEFLIAERRGITQRSQDRVHLFAVGNARFQFDAGTVAGGLASTFMSELPG